MGRTVFAGFPQLRQVCGDYLQVDKVKKRPRGYLAEKLKHNNNAAKRFTVLTKELFSHF